MRNNLTQYFQWCEQFFIETCVQFEYIFVGFFYMF